MLSEVASGAKVLFVVVRGVRVLLFEIGKGIRVLFEIGTGVGAAMAMRPYTVDIKRSMMQGIPSLGTLQMPREFPAVVRVFTIYVYQPRTGPP